MVHNNEIRWKLLVKEYPYSADSTHLVEINHRSQIQFAKKALCAGQLIFHLFSEKPDKYFCLLVWNSRRLYAISTLSLFNVFDGMGVGNIYS